jgi:tRNA A37 threonylcarbamoyladenosine synthetase subunit TsaC/SUA5/YrdC
VVENTLGGLLDYLLDTGLTPGGPPSTIVDLVETEPRLLRTGAIDWREIRQWLLHANL